MQLGPPELILILLIVVLLFGVGRIGRIGGELGTAIGNFRKGLQEANDDENIKNEELEAEEQEAAQQRLTSRK